MISWVWGYVPCMNWEGIRVRLQVMDIDGLCMCEHWLGKYVHFYCIKSVCILSARAWYVGGGGREVATQGFLVWCSLACGCKGKQLVRWVQARLCLCPYKMVPSCLAPKEHFFIPPVLRKSDFYIFSWQGPKGIFPLQLRLNPGLLLSSVC